MMTSVLRVLIVEDSEDDALLLVRELRREGFEPDHARVDTAETMTAALQQGKWDVILSDFSMPNFNALEALKVAQEVGDDIPFIIVSGTVSEDAAVEAMRAGASDYFSKGKLTRLGPAIQRELREAEERRNHRMAEEKLRQSEEQLRLLLETAPEAVIMTDAEGRILRANAITETIFGYTRADLIGQSIELLMPDQYRAIHQSHRAEYVESPQARLMGAGRELWGRRKDGTDFPIDVGLSAVETPEGMIVASFVTDISERRRIEEQLRYQAALLANVSEAVISTGLDGTIRSWNRWAEAMYGWTADEVVNQQPVTILSTVFAEDSEAEAREKLAQHGEWRSEVIQHHKDGSPIHVMSSVSYVTDARGLRIGMVAVNRDISERKRVDNELRKSEERFATVFHRSPVPTGISRIADGHIVDVNDAFVEMTGYERGELIGRTAIEVGLWANPEKRGEAVAGISDTGEAHSLELEGRTKSGDTLHLLASAGLIDLEGEPHMVSMFYDITERKRMEAELLEAERLRVELETERELIELKERFISMVSHEFRTPLTVIMSSAEMVQRYYDRMTVERQFKHLREVVSQSRFMVTLLDDVLTVNKARSGRLDFEPELMDLVAFCSETIERLQAVDEGRHTFDFTHKGDLSAVMLDAKLMQHILVNLLSNAIKYSPDGGTVGLDVTRLDDGVEIRVSDEGIGIPEEAQARLFEPFHRAANVGNIHGTGLGLAIVKESVERLGGTIRCESVVGEGTRFEVYLKTVQVC